MAPLIHIPDFLKNSALFLDTNFLVDSYSYPNDYAKLILALRKRRVTLVSLNFVKYEFIGSKTADVVRKKEKYFDEVVEAILPFDLQTEFLVVGLIGEYKQYMEGLPLTDLLIGACLKRYHKLYLLTRDHKDFPTTIYDRMHIINVGLVRAINSYGVYAYKPKSKVLG